jgi:hypothetical protein
MEDVNIRTTTLARVCEVLMVSFNAFKRGEIYFIHHFIFTFFNVKRKWKSE